MGIENKDQPKNIPNITFGINIAAGMALFTIIGNWIDKKLGDQHFWIFIGIFLGLFYSGYEIWKLIRQGNNDQNGETNIQTSSSENE